jgi:hypothetical protein
MIAIWVLNIIWVTVATFTLVYKTQYLAPYVQAYWRRVQTSAPSSELDAAHSNFENHLALYIHVVVSWLISLLLLSNPAIFSTILIAGVLGRVGFILDILFLLWVTHRNKVRSVRMANGR